MDISPRVHLLNSLAASKDLGAQLESSVTQPDENQEECWAVTKRTGTGWGSLSFVPKGPE